MSQNSVDSSNGNNSRNIPAVVNNHADRLMDELFADIEEMLSGDLSEQKKISSEPIASTHAPINPAAPVEPVANQPAVNYPPEPEYPQPLPTPVPVAIDTPPKGGLWKKVLAGLGLTTLLVGGGVWWLAREGKINLGALPVSGLSNGASNADIKFADYLSKSLNKLENSTVPSPANPPSATGSSIAIPNPPGVVDVPAPVPVPTDAIFSKIISSNPPLVEFTINGQTQQVKAGEAIGNSGWILTNVINTVDNEVVIKRNGELRSLKAGQQF